QICKEGPLLLDVPLATNGYWHADQKCRQTSPIVSSPKKCMNNMWPLRAIQVHKVFERGDVETSRLRERAHTDASDVFKRRQKSYCRSRKRYNAHVRVPGDALNEVKQLSLRATGVESADCITNLHRTFGSFGTLARAKRIHEIFEYSSE